PPEKELARRVALVTGGASGIGQAIAHALATAGASLVVTDLDGPGAEAVASEIVARQGQGAAIAQRLDVTSEADVERACERACLEYGGLDLLVSNAGIARVAALDELSLDDWQRGLAVNATGHFLVARAALRLFKRQGIGGNVVFVVTKNALAPGREM